LRLRAPVQPITQSMGRVGSALDNPASESFFSTLKFDHAVTAHGIDRSDHHPRQLSRRSQEGWLLFRYSYLTKRTAVMTDFQPTNPGETPAPPGKRPRGPRVRRFLASRKRRWLAGDSRGGGVRGDRYLPGRLGTKSPSLGKPLTWMFVLRSGSGKSDLLPEDEPHAPGVAEP
jgi:hypothetical protein